MLKMKCIAQYPFLFVSAWRQGAGRWSESLCLYRDQSSSAVQTCFTFRVFQSQCTCVFVSIIVH